jgi:large subunit ribosomal protein L2
MFRLPFSSSSSVHSSVLSFSSFVFPSFSCLSSFSLRSFATLNAAKLADEKLFADKLKRFRPITSTLGNTVLTDRSGLWRGQSHPDLTVGKRKTGGRSRTTGHVTVRGRGGGAKRNYRIIDFKRNLFDIAGKVERLEYDPNRSAFIALVLYENKELRYILAPDGIKVGDKIISSKGPLPLKSGNCMPLSCMPVGTQIHNIELTPGRGGQIARGAGTLCTLIDKTSKAGYALVELTSKEQRYILLKCAATVGQLGNRPHRLQKIGKAGRNRNLGWRPKVRGMAMNPIDHPLGGGNGKSKGRHPCSPTGVLAKGFKTRDKRKINKLIVVPRGGVVQGESGFSGATSK